MVLNANGWMLEPMWVGMVGQGEYQRIPATGLIRPSLPRYASSISREIACVNLLTEEMS